MLSCTRALARETLRLVVGFGQLSVRHRTTPGGAMARTRAQKAAEVGAQAAAIAPAEAVLAAEVRVEPQAQKGPKRKASSNSHPAKRPRKQAIRNPQLPEPDNVTELDSHSQAKAQPKRRRAKPKKESVAIKTEYDVELVTTEQDAENAATTTKKVVFHSKRPPAVVKGTTEIADDVLARLPASARQKFVGCHVSISGGLERAVINAAAMGAKAFAMDTRNKQRWESPPIKPETAAAFKDALTKFNLSPDHILPHGSYLINLGSANEEIYRKSFDGFMEELRRCEVLGLRLYNFHPGSTSGLCEPEESLARIASSINRAHAETSGVTVVLENMAGSGNSVGHKFENLKYVIDRVDDKSRVGVCLDTCHLYAAGFDVATEEGYAETFDSFERIVGLEYLKALHVNDSKGALSSRRDRHANIGLGLIGIDCFKRLINDPRFDGLPLIMETPVQCAGPKINYPVSLRDSCIAFHETEQEAGVCTDKRDIEMLYTLCT